MRFGQIMHELSEFLKFYINAVNLHSIHSPSVFRILSSLERDQEMPELADLNLWWDSLKGDSTATSGDQYGAGTRISRPTISSAARISSSSDKKASINYLVDVGKFCKENDTSIRRNRYKKTLNELLNDI